MPTYKAHYDGPQTMEVEADSAWAAEDKVAEMAAGNWHVVEVNEDGTEVE